MSAADRIVTAILDAEDIDILAAAQYAAFFLREDERTALAQALEICPMHWVDRQICADDGVTECEDIR